MLTAPSVLASASSFWVRSEPVRLEYFAKGPALALPPLLGACVVGEVPHPASMSAAVASGPAARLQLGDVGGEDLVAGQVEPQAPVVAPGPLRHLHVPEVVRDDQALDRWVLAVELVPCGDLRRRPVPLLVGEHTELVILAHHCLLACGRRSEGRGARACVDGTTGMV